jgi:hypothetical protein
MTHSTKLWPLLAAVTFSLAGCATGGMQESGRPNLSATQCHDLAAVRSHAPVTRERNRSELAALEDAGWYPGSDDPDYPDDLQAAQRQVDHWYQAECPAPAGQARGTS